MTTREKLAQMKASEAKNAEAEAKYRGASWKQTQLHALAYRYGRLAEKWHEEQHHDDRDVYVRTYSMILRALRSMPPSPDLYVRVAVGEKMRKDFALMDRIARRFERSERRDAGGDAGEQ